MSGGPISNRRNATRTRNAVNIRASRAWRSMEWNAELTASCRARFNGSKRGGETFLSTSLRPRSAYRYAAIVQTRRVKSCLAKSAQNSQSGSGDRSPVAPRQDSRTSPDASRAIGSQPPSECGVTQKRGTPTPPSIQTPKRSPPSKDFRTATRSHIGNFPAHCESTDAEWKAASNRISPRVRSANLLIR